MDSGGIMTAERKESSPRPSRRERESDLHWLGENFRVFYPFARMTFQTEGRGAIVVDTTSQPIPGRGNPFAYFPQAKVEASGDPDLQRMVREYDPKYEIVVQLLKSAGRTSIYRMGLHPERRKP